MKREYTKTPLNYTEQLSLLKSRGLQISNDKEAISLLEKINYYRLSAYFIPFEEKRHKFKKHTSLTQIQKLYEFDSKLRHLIIASLEIIEIYFRSKIAYILSNKYNNVFIHEEDSIFFDKNKHLSWIEKIHTETIRSQEIFVTHYRNTYKEFPKLPIWVAVEIMSFGSLSIFYFNLIKEDQKEISKILSLHHTVLSSWLHTFTYIRNICAHHSRLWNRNLAIAPHLPKKWGNINNKKIISVIFAINYLLQHIPIDINILYNWKKDIENLIENNSSILNDFYSYMGFFENWTKHKLWK